METSDRQALDLLSASGDCGLTLTRHLVNYIYFKKGASRNETGSKDVVANGRVWSGHSALNGEAHTESEVKRKVFWGELPILQDARAGFTIPSTSLHLSSVFPFIPMFKLTPSCSTR